MGKKRFRSVLAAGTALVATALVAATASFALQRPKESWDAEANSAARRRIVELAPARADVRFADVKVRQTGGENERSVCGAFAVWNDKGSLGPFRDFWVVVTKGDGPPASVERVDVMAIPQDAFLDRGSDYYRHCFARIE